MESKWPTIGHHHSEVLKSIVALKCKCKNWADYIPDKMWYYVSENFIFLLF